MYTWADTMYVFILFMFHKTWSDVYLPKRNPKQDELSVFCHFFIVLVPKKAANTYHLVIQYIIDWRLSCIKKNGYKSDLSAYEIIKYNWIVNLRFFQTYYGATVLEWIHFFFELKNREILEIRKWPEEREVKNWPCLRLSWMAPKSKFTFIWKFYV